MVKNQFKKLEQNSKQAQAIERILKWWRLGYINTGIDLATENGLDVTELVKLYEKDYYGK